MALRWNAIRAAVASPTDLAECDIVVLAGPPSSIAQAAQEVLRSGRAMVTDIAGVKAPIVAALADVAGVERFVGGHPMAGNEFASIAHADPNIFTGATWILTPTDATAPSTIATVEDMVASLGCPPRRMTPEEHDAQVGLVSHLPNLLANLLTLMAADRGGSDIAGGSWRDLTRVAGGNPSMWVDLLSLNRGNVLAISAELRERLEAVETMLSTSGSGSLRALLEQAARAKGGSG